MRARIQDIHKVIDRALASNCQPPNVHGDDIERRKWLSDMMNRSRGSRLGSSGFLSGRRRGSIILKAASANDVTVVQVDPSMTARAQAAEVSIDLCFNDHQDKTTLLG